ncbi:DUF1883 domain-containing protein [Blastopirellula retiformator]|uniref:DUF1883 domain-containing protein n=1 Tax=Blastopirellula retiformator TaxID=2527970 RepID=UPI0011B4C81B
MACKRSQVRSLYPPLKRSFALDRKRPFFLRFAAEASVHRGCAGRASEPNALGQRILFSQIGGRLEFNKPARRSKWRQHKLRSFCTTTWGECSKDRIVEVKLSGSANVQLMDAANLALQKRGESYRYYGGHVTKSPFRIRIPRNGQWHVAIDLGGAAGQVTASVRLV